MQKIEHQKKKKNCWTIHQINHLNSEQKNDDSRGTSNTNSQIKFKTSMLRSRLCHVWILVSGTITVAKGTAGGQNNNIEEAFKNSPPFTHHISRINNT